jgi:hypothetical protein
VGFDTGLYVAATKSEPTRQYSVPTWSLTNNVVSGAKTGQAYFGGQQVPASNRTE